MSRALCCPYCAAPITKRMCEYCGRDTVIELVSADEAFKMMCDERFISCEHYTLPRNFNKLYYGEIGILNGARIVIEEKPSE